MATCPSCGTQVDTDFGMATCPSCSLMFMIGFDGTAQMPVATDYASDETVQQNPDENPEAQSIEDSGEMAPTYVGTELPQEDDSGGYVSAGTEVRSEVYGDQDMAEDILADESMAEGTEVYQRPPPEDSAYDENFLTNGFGNDPEFDTQDDPPIEPPIEPDGPKDPLGVQKFDGHAASQLVDGPYYYDLYISGLDTAQIKDEVMKALTDKRFQWRYEEIKAKLRNGRLIFKDLNPVKAVLIVIKLQHIDVEIQWVQKLHTDPSVAGGT